MQRFMGGEMDMAQTEMAFSKMKFNFQNGCNTFKQKFVINQSLFFILFFGGGSDSTRWLIYQPVQYIVYIVAIYY